MRRNRSVFAGIISVHIIVSIPQVRALEPVNNLPGLLHPTGVTTQSESPPDSAAGQLDCTSNADCDDGDFCNGFEVCSGITGECQAGLQPCPPYQTCESVMQACVDPDPCITWRAGAPGEYFLPQANNCPDTATWVFDDIQTSKHGSDMLQWYTTPLVARSTPLGASPLGTVYSADQALWTVESLTCNPLVMIPGTECTNSGVVAPAGSPPDPMPCSGTMPVLPNSDGDFDRCEIDFFIAYRTAENGAGWSFPTEQQLIGGPAATDDFGIDVIWFEDCPPTGTFSYAIFENPHIAYDFADAEVCQTPLGTCCATDGGCSLTIEADCSGAWGAQIGTVADGPPACEGDVDGDGIDGICGDNCPNAANPLQEDCDGDGEGNACEDAFHQDGDGDGVCNGDDNCVFTPNPGQEDCDGDLLGDHCDPCPCDNPDDSDADGVCDSNDLCPGHNDNIDSDGDGVPDGCDLCPGSDDNAPGARDDVDGDGVVNCTDQCPGVDDAVFAPECEGAIPTVSAWGLVIMALLLLAGMKIGFTRARMDNVTA